jgi:hypothetical protein
MGLEPELSGPKPQFHKASDDRPAPVPLTGQAQEAGQLPYAIIRPAQEEAL